MCCGGSANWKREEVPDHKFDFIDVREYYTNGCLTQLRYVFLYVMVVKSFAVYVADIYTAVTLLAFGHFNGSIYDKVQNDPDNNFRVPISYGRWIFTGCIIFSFLLLAYEAHKARAVVKSRDISYAYTNVMANNYYSMRSYNHFCFFSQINNSKKKKDEFAFFIFFTFKGWKRLLVADGPRQVINFFTLYGLGSFANWSTDPYDYYQGNVWTGIMLLTMLFTVAVFAASLILLIIAALMYLPLLCYIKGNLKEYCCHKIDKRISELVKRKKKQRLVKQAAIARKEAAGDFSHLMNKKGEMIGQAIPQPTLPNVDVDLFDDKPASIPLQRTNSVGSSTAVHGNGYYGEKGPYKSPSFGAQHFYGASSTTLGEYGSSANLVKNAAPPGGDSMLGAPSLPPSNGTNPDSGPVHFRGMEPLLNEMGPIGTSPMLFAQKVGGQGRHSPAPVQSGNPYHDQQHGNQRTLVDPMGRTVLSPLNPEAGSQSPYHQPQRVQGHRNEGPYANAGLDYPPPTNNHGVQGLDFPPPPPPDMSLYVPYQETEHDDQARRYDGHATDLAYGYDHQTAYGYDTQSNTLHDHGGGHSDPNQAVGVAVADYHQHPDANGTMAPPAHGQPDLSVGGGYEDLYDAYMSSQGPSRAVTPEARTHANSEARGYHAGGEGWQGHPEQQQYGYEHAQDQAQNDWNGQAGYHPYDQHYDQAEAAHHGYEQGVAYSQHVQVHRGPGDHGYSGAPNGY